MEFTILAFGNIADLLGAHEITVRDILSKDDLIRVLNNRYPELNGLKYAIAVNRKISFENEVFDTHTEIALIPPYSGG
jgi:sulfur-carrier protein